MSQAAYTKTVEVSADDGSTWLKLPATSPSMEIGGDVLDDTNLKSNSGYRSRILGLHDWNVQADSNYDAADTGLIAVRDAKLNRTALKVRYLPTGSADAAGLVGDCVVESFNLSGDVGGLETVSISLQANGALAAANA